MIYVSICIHIYIYIDDKTRNWGCDLFFSELSCDELVLILGVFLLGVYEK